MTATCLPDSARATPDTTGTSEANRPTYGNSRATPVTALSRATPSIGAWKSTVCFLFHHVRLKLHFARMADTVGDAARREEMHGRNCDQTLWVAWQVWYWSGRSRCAVYDTGRLRRRRRRRRRAFQSGGYRLFFDHCRRLSGNAAVECTESGYERRVHKRRVLSDPLRHVVNQPYANRDCAGRHSVVHEQRHHKCLRSDTELHLSHQEPVFRYLVFRRSGDGCVRAAKRLLKHRA